MAAKRATADHRAARCRSAFVDALVLSPAWFRHPARARRSGDKHPRSPGVEEQARRDGGLTGSDDPSIAESSVAYNSPWPLVAWPAVPTRFVVCTEDRFFPAAFLRRVVAERLGIVPDEIAAGHCVALSRAEELARLLDSYARTLAS